MSKTKNDYASANYGKKITGKRRPAKKTPAKAVKIAFLGGLNEIGKNLTVFEFEDDMIILDCGLAFPDTDMLGVDLVIPDFSYLEKNVDKIRGIIVTHGHEDHIGGLPYLLKTINVPVYSSKLTIGLIKGKLKEHKLLELVTLNEIAARDVITLGKFSVEAIHVNHSIPDALAFAIKTPAGVVVHTGDFKIDTMPIDGDVIDLARFAELGKQGVICLMADSTNAERPGYTESESTVGETFESLFRKAEGKRLIVASFASNIHRVQQIINVAAKLGRKVALSGRSLENVVAISTELGYLSVPDGVLISIDEVKNKADDKLVIITTGSQGEPMSALTRMSTSEHRKVQIGANDFIIISATPIPGNEKTVGKVVNELMKLGAEVVYDRMYDVHVSGHAKQEELKLLMGLVKPKYFVPVHGEQKHLRFHAALAESLGVPHDNIVIADNGHVLSVSRNEIAVSGTAPCGRVFVDGYGVGDVGSVVLRDRKRLSEDGIIIISVAVDTYTGDVVTAPEIVSKGFVYVKESEELFTMAKDTVYDVLDKFADNSFSDMQAVKSRIREEIARLMYERTKRSPIIVPIIMSVNL
ncbi:MAG: ribonuclease J [Oscillospiraceae bacterium]|jgi:ribonuclease J|nr:ribonuclease J [Oscillospiraceae bacterium]